MIRSRPIALLMVLAGLIAFGTGQPARAQNPFVLQPESRVWIEGTSTVSAFTCEAEDVRGSGSLSDARARAEARVDVPVSTFDCGNEKMNRDLYEAMQAPAHPVIRYDMEKTDVLDVPLDGEGWHRLRTRGTLAIAGAERQIELTLRGRRLPDGRVRATGSMPLLMSDYGIEPPTALLGLIKARDRIVVHFDLVAASSDADVLAWQ